MVNIYNEYASVKVLMMKLKHISTFCIIYHNIDVVELDFIDDLHCENLSVKIDSLYAEYKNTGLINEPLLADAEKAASAEFADAALQTISKDAHDYIDALFEILKASNM